MRMRRRRFMLLASQPHLPCAVYSLSKSRRRAMLAVATMAAAAAAAPAWSAVPRSDRNKVSLVVGGKMAFHHLPLTVAEQLGYFRHEGLVVDINDVGTPARAIQSMLEGGHDVCAGSYEHTLVLQARGLPLQQAFVIQTRTPQVAFGVSMRNPSGLKSLADLKGKRIGLAQFGSVDAMVVMQLLARVGLRVEDVSLVELGASNQAVTAIRSGVVDALSHFDPVMTMLEQKGEVRIMGDTRMLKGTVDLFGGLMPSACLHAPVDFLQKNPGTCQALSNAIVHALKWLQTAGPSDLIKTVPEHYFQGDRALYLASFLKSRESISPDGLMPADGAQAALRALSAMDSSLRVERILTGRSYTNEFARRAKDRFKA